MIIRYHNHNFLHSFSRACTIHQYFNTLHYSICSSGIKWIYNFNSFFNACFIVAKIKNLRLSSVQFLLCESNSYFLICYLERLDEGIDKINWLINILLGLQKAWYQPLLDHHNHHFGLRHFFIHRAWVPQVGRICI